MIKYIIFWIVLLQQALFARSYYINELEEKFYSSLYNNELVKAQSFFDQFIKTTSPKSFNYKNEYSPGDIQIYLDAVKSYKQAGTKKINAAVLYIERVDFRYTNSKGEPRHVTGQFDGDIQKAEQSLQLFSKVISFYTENQVDMTFHPVFLKGTTLEKVKVIPYRETGQISLIASPLSIVPYPAFFYENAHKYDLFIIVIPSNQRGLSSAGLVSFKNAALDSMSPKRGLIIISNERIMIPQTLVHEYLHIVESIFSVKEKHFYEEKNKKNWPSWYTGEGQLTYYKHFFKNIVLKNDFKKLLLVQTYR